jgi:hypothetical protein
VEIPDIQGGDLGAAEGRNVVSQQASSRAPVTSPLKKRSSRA